VIANIVLPDFDNLTGLFVRSESGEIIPAESESEREVREGYQFLTKAMIETITAQPMDIHFFKNQASAFQLCDISFNVSQSVVNAGECCLYIVKTF